MASRKDNILPLNIKTISNLHQLLQNVPTNKAIYKPVVNCILQT